MREPNEDHGLILEPIDDLDHDLLVPYRALKDVQVRRRGLYIAESELVLRRAIDAREPIVSVLVVPDRAERIRELLMQARVRVGVVSPAVLKETLGFPLHRGVIALVRRRPPLLVADLVSRSGDAAGGRVLVALEDVVDPENVGAIIRHVAGFGALGVALSPNAGDPFFRKAVRASMGSVFSVPIARVEDSHELVADLRAQGFATIGLTPADGAAELHEVLAQLPGRDVALVLGAEQPGLRPETLAAVDHRARIAMVPGIDSFNVATCAAIALYAWQRANPAAGPHEHPVVS